MKVSGRRARAVLALALALSTRDAAGQDPPRGTTPPTSLRGRIGVDAATALATSGLVADRLRGLERLGAAGTPRAVARLVRAIEPGGSATTAEERLTAVRVLAGFTGDGDVRRALTRAMGGHATPTSAGAPEPLDVLAEQTAALALARTGSVDALAALGKALVTPGRASAAAHVALVAHPPNAQGALDSLLRAATALPTPELAATLADLADPQTGDALRTLVLHGAPEVRAVAATALARLGDPDVVPLARRWRDATAPGVLRVAAARVLATAHASDAGAAIAALLGDDATRSDGIALALDAPAPALVAPLSRLVERATATESRDVLTAIGRAGGAGAATLLGSLLRDPTRGPAAANALARMPGPEANRILRTALTAPATRRIAAHAGVVRRLVLSGSDGALPELHAALATLLVSRDEADHALGAAGLAAEDPKRIEALALPSNAFAPSVSPLLLLAPREVAIRMAARIASATTDQARAALAFALVVPGAEDQVPTGALVALAGSGDPAASALAARALAARDEPRLRPTVTALLGSPDPTLRAHTALGLGRSARPDATGLLESAYPFEPDPRVRAAIARALAMRSAADGRTLTLARELDPDPETREAAGAPPIAGVGRVTPPAHGSQVLWIFETRSQDTAPGLRATIETPEGLSLPVVLGPDGQAIAAGLPPGSRETPPVRVALAHEPDDDSRRGVSGNEKSKRSEGDGREP